MGLKKIRGARKTWKKLQEDFQRKYQRHIQRTRAASQRSEPSNRKSPTDISKDPKPAIPKAQDTSTTPTYSIPIIKTMADANDAAWPKADPALAQELLDLVQQAGHYRQLKKGAK